MGVSPGKSKSNAVNAGRAAFSKVLVHKILYRAWFFVALLVCVALSTVSATAQEERPQITPGERRVPKKKDAGPRAVAVLQLAPNGKASLVPIAILVGGKFWDATAYKADPIPMALEPGTVYEAEHAGNSLGLFTVNTALHSNAVNAQMPWLGTGLWVPEGSEQPKTALKAEKQPVGIESADAPPRLTRRASAPNDAQPASDSSASQPHKTAGGSTGSAQTNPGQSTPSQTNPSQTNPSQSGPSQSTPSQNPSSQTGPSSTTPTPPAPNAPASTPGGSKPADSKTSDSKPSDAKPANSKPVDHPSTAQSDSGADEGNRPRLRRGKPVDPLPEDDVPGYSKPGAVGSVATAPNAANPGKASDSAAEKTPVQLIPAISDAGGPQPKSFGFDWLKDEEGERLQQMTALAREQVRAYVEAQAKAKIVPPAKPAGPQTARHTAPAKASARKTPDPILDNIQMKTFDLWGNNQPVMVFSADAHMPPPTPGTPHAAADADLQYSILLVASPDIYHNLHKQYSGISDKYHLDITPRLELVDAVDADGDGRGELLFREVSDNSSGWIIYRASADKLWKLFDSLNPE